MLPWIELKARFHLSDSNFTNDRAFSVSEAWNNAGISPANKKRNGSKNR